jgi:hypothetical protein
MGGRRLPMNHMDIGEWLELWCDENINATSRIEKKSQMRDFAEKCAEAAEAADIKITELKKAAGGDLETYLMNFQNRFADRQAAQ